MRVIDPVTVSTWFRPPVQGNVVPNGTFLLPLSAKPLLCNLLTNALDLELYTIWTDGFQLLTLSFILILISDAVPLPKSLTGSALAETTPTKAKKPYARGIILITMFHHVTTGIGAFQHWRLPTHHTVAMDIGVYFNVLLTGMGVAALVYGLRDEEGGRKKKA